MKQSHIEQIARQAIELSEGLTPILRELMEVVQNYDLVEARRKLLAVEQSVRQLESAGVPVPEELLSHQSDLNRMLKGFAQAVEALHAVRNSMTALALPQKRRKPSQRASVPNRCTIANLISAGFLMDGMQIFHRDMRSEKVIKGYIREPGYIEVELEGRIERFDSPSSAGTMVSGRSTNGWIYWFVFTSNDKKVILDEYRQKFLRQKKNV